MWTDVPVSNIRASKRICREKPPGKKKVYNERSFEGVKERTKLKGRNHFAADYVSEDVIAEC